MKKASLRKVARSGKAKRSAKLRRRPVTRKSPSLPLDRAWVLHVDTARPDLIPVRASRSVRVAASSVAVLALESQPIAPRA